MVKPDDPALLRDWGIFFGFTLIFVFDAFYNYLSGWWPAWGAWLSIEMNALMLSTCVYFAVKILLKERTQIAQRSPAPPAFSFAKVDPEKLKKRQEWAWPTVGIIGIVYVTLIVWVLLVDLGGGLYLIGFIATSVGAGGFLIARIRRTRVKSPIQPKEAG